MLTHELSPDEQETLATYECERIVRINSEANLSVEYGVQEFRYFSHLLPSGRILDLGCGSAPHARFFSQPDYEYVGIDMSVGMLRQAKEWEPDKIFFRMHMRRIWKMNGRYGPILFGKMFDCSGYSRSVSAYGTLFYKNFIFLHLMLLFCHVDKCLFYIFYLFSIISAW